VDGGTSDWIECNNGLPASAWVRFITINSTAPNELVIADIMNGVFKTTDCGASWTQKTNGLTSIPSSLERAPGNPNILYVGSNEGLIFKSSDNAENWVCTNASSPLPFSVLGIQIDPYDADLVYCGGSGIDNFWKSTDGGYTWVLKNNGIVGFNGFTGYFIIDPVNSNNIYLSGYSGGMHKSIDYGETWFFSGEGLRVQTKTFVVDFSDPDILYAAGGLSYGGCGVYKSTDKGVTWFRANNGFRDDVKYPYVTDMVMDPKNPDILYVAGAPMQRIPISVGICKTTDAGNMWVEKNNGLTSDKLSALVINPVDPNILYTSSTAGVFKTVDAAENWALVLDDTLAQSLAIDPQNPSTIYVGTDGPAVIYKSTDAGETWTSMSLPDTSVICITIAPTNSNTIYVGTEVGVNVFKSTDAGQTWHKKSNGLPEIYSSYEWRLSGGGLNTLVVDPLSANIVYAGVAHDRGAIYKTADGGETWEVMNDNYFGFTPSRLVIDPTDRNTLYAAARGIWSYTSSSLEGPTITPKKAIAYANPARGSHVLFAYHLDSNAEVTLRVYNLAKELVASVTESQLAGDRFTRLDISEIPPGIYLYQITTEDAATGDVEHWQRQKLAIIR